MAEKLERIYTVPLRNAYGYVRTKRTKRAVKLLREFLCRHMKAEEGDVAISNALNSYIWQRSMQKPPRRVKIRAIKEDGRVMAYLADEKIEEAKKEEKKKPKEEKKEEKTAEEKKKDELKKEQTQKAEAAMAEKEAEKAMKDEQAKIDIAEKKKMVHGKETR